MSEGPKAAQRLCTFEPSLFDAQRLSFLGSIVECLDFTAPDRAASEMDIDVGTPHHLEKSNRGFRACYIKWL